MSEALATLKELDLRLRDRRKLTDLFEDYYAGRHRLAYATAKYEDAFGSLFGAFADNWMGVIADTPVERLAVEGFTIAGDADADVWKVWQENDMELHSSVAMLGAVKTGHSYILVDNTGDKPSLHVWPSSMAIVKYDPKTRKAIAGMTTWVETDGRISAEVYLPDEITTFRTKEPQVRGLTKEQNVVTPPTDSVPGGQGTATVSTLTNDGDWQVVVVIDNPNDDGSIPLVEITNRPNELGIGRSDLADVLALQDAINKLSNDMIIASEFQAFRQRVLTGVEIPKNPETGEPLPTQQIEAAISRLWAFEPADAKVWDLPATDLSNYVSGIKELLNHLAAQTRTPPHYLIGQMVNVSGEALAAAESGLVSRVEAKQKSFTIAFREIMRLATGKPALEISWKNPERQSFAAIADGVPKLMASPELSLSREEGYRLLGYSPLQVKKMVADAKARSSAQPPNSTSTKKIAPTDMKALPPGT